MASLVAWLPWLLLALYLLDVLAHSRRRLPPGPRPLPLIGSLHLLGNHPHSSLADLATTYGPLMSLRQGAVTTVVVSSPGMASELLKKHDAVFAARSVPDATGDHAKNSVPWLPGSPRWRALRRIMATELFAPLRLDALQHLRRGKVQELVDHIARQASEGAAVHIGLAAFTTILNLLSRTIFSRDLTSLGRVGDHGESPSSSSSREFHEVVVEIMEAAGLPNVSDFFPALAAADLQGLRRRMDGLFARLHRVFDALVDERLRDREAGEPRKGDFLDVLLDVMARENDSSGLDRDVLRSLFLDLFAAGSDTSSTTVEWAMAELMRNPLCMARACNELSQVIGLGRNIEESEIGQLPYLQAVVKETFRLHPPAPLLLPRKAESTTNIAGYTVPKGARVLVNVWAMGRDTHTWSAPEKFIPERFLEGKIDFRGVHFELIPFGAGRRICPGLPLANRMVHLILGSMLNQFKWSLSAEMERNGIDMSEKFGLALVKAVPLCALATPVSVKPSDHDVL
uniref:Cytochrome P450 n=1 Tax=Oryza brachyantha TaxID=4533 RepID=J3N166_ORYBR